jgi:hypothetical protein
MKRPFAISMIISAATLLAAFGVVWPCSGAAQDNPRLASLEIEIWPEFDRPAALVILKGEFATDLPDRAVSLRIPASSGGPVAVAFAAAAGAELFNLKYDRTDAKDFITLHFKVPQRFFQIEFYDPVPTNSPDRKYTYTWAGDMGTKRLSVHLQEPAAASNLSTQPALGAGVSGPNGLLYRTAELGAFEAGKQLPIEVRYTKTDSRTSAQILGIKTAGPESSAEPAAPAGPTAPVAPVDTPPVWLLVLTFAAVLLIAATVALLWWHWHNKGSGAQSGTAGMCHRCSGPIASGDRFCSACGARVRAHPHGS